MFSQYKKEDFKKHHIVKAINGQNLAETDTISANKQIEAVLLGKKKKIVETRAGFLAIEVRDKIHSMVFVYHTMVHKYSLRKLNGVDVEVKADDRMNQIKGTIRYENCHNYPTERILEELKQSKAVDIYQMKRKRNGESPNIYCHI